MQQQKVILITGMPGAGKTTLVKELQKKYANAVAVSVDLIQESLYDTLGFASPDERRKLKAAAFKIALDEALDYTEQGLVPLLEYPFCDRHKEMLTSALKNKNILNLRLDLPLEEAYRRFHERDLSGKRHPVITFRVIRLKTVINRHIRFLKITKAQCTARIRRNLKWAEP